MVAKGMMPLDGPDINYWQNNQRKKPKTLAEGRKKRWDKQIEVKFPIVPKYEEQLIYFYKKYKMKYDVPGIAVFNSMLMRFALRNPGIISHDYEYIANKNYKRMYVNQIENEIIDGLEGFTTKWRIPKREVAYRLVMSSLHYLLSGGELDYEKTLPFKPTG